MNATQARAAEFTAGEVGGVFDDTVGYYPGGEKMFAKMLFDRNTDRILGVQAAGESDVIRRIDAVAALMQFNAMLNDVIEFEPAYVPPYGDPIDPLHYLAYIAQYIIRDGTEGASPYALSGKNYDEIAVLDLRNDTESGNFPLPDGDYEEFRIPIDQLRQRAGEIRTDRRIVTVCQRGRRAYEAVRILKENGISGASFMGGGMLFAIIRND